MNCPIPVHRMGDVQLPSADWPAYSRFEMNALAHVPENRSSGSEEHSGRQEAHAPSFFKGISCQSVCHGMNDDPEVVTMPATGDGSPLSTGKVAWPCGHAATLPLDAHLEPMPPITTFHALRGIREKISLAEPIENADEYGAEVVARAASQHLARAHVSDLDQQIMPRKSSRTAPRILTAIDRIHGGPRTLQTLE